MIVVAILAFHFKSVFNMFLSLINMLCCCVVSSLHTNNILLIQCWKNVNPVNTITDRLNSVPATRTSLFRHAHRDGRYNSKDIQ